MKILHEKIKLSLFINNIITFIINTKTMWTLLKFKSEFSKITKYKVNIPTTNYRKYKIKNVKDNFYSGVSQVALAVKSE